MLLVLPILLPGEETEVGEEGRCRLCSCSPPARRLRFAIVELVVADVDSLDGDDDDDDDDDDGLRVVRTKDLRLRRTCVCVRYALSCRCGGIGSGAWVDLPRCCEGIVSGRNLSRCSGRESSADSEFDIEGDPAELEGDALGSAAVT